MEYLGFALAITIGISLGLIGGGGSILTVPVLVYVMDIDPVKATAYSLFVVGTSALVGSVRYMQKRLVNFKIGAIFTIPAFIAVFSTRRFIVPALPDVVFHSSSLTITKDSFLMGIFALLMVLASFSMIRKSKPKTTEAKSHSYAWVMLEGLVVGVLTGLVGAGGGFLIIPALVLLAGLPMKEAVGTSLLVIAFKSLTGFIGDVLTQAIDWQLLLIFTVFAIGGIFIGTYLARFISNKLLKQVFGYFLIVLAVFIFVKEF